MKFNFILILCIIMLSLSSVSAFDWDNVKSYDKDTKEVIIKNAFGLPLIGDDLGKVKLLSPLKFHTPIGYTHIAEFEITSYPALDNVIKNMEMYDVKRGMEKFERDYDLKYKTIEYIEVDDYETSCKNWDDDMKDCNRTYLGSHIREKVVWRNLTDVNFDKDENLTIRIYTDVKKGETGEWILTFFGVRVTEWAEWTADLNVDLRSYYTLNQTTGVVLDSHTTGNDGSPNSSLRGITGKIADSFQFNDSTLSSFGNYDIASYLVTGITFSLWLNTTSTTGKETFIGIIDVIESKTILVGIATNADHNWGVGLGKIGMLLLDLDGNKLEAGTTNSVSINDGAWHHIVVYVRGVDNYAEIWVDGVNQSMSYTDQNTPDNLSTPNAFNFGGFYNYNTNSIATPAFNGGIDELATWNRSLTGAEIADLYNSGTGITYATLSAGTAPTMELVSPIAGLNQTSTGVDFEFNFTCNSTNPVGVRNVTLVFDGENNLTVTNTSVAQNITLSTLIRLPPGSYNYTCTGKNDFGVTTPSVRFFNYSQEVINVTPTSPVDNYVTPSPFVYTTSDVNAVGLSIKNVTTILDGSVNQTNTTTFNGTYNFNFTGLATGSYTWFYRAFDTNNVSWDGASRTFVISSVNVTLVNPIDTFNSSNTTVDFQCLGQNAIGLLNFSLIIDGSTNLTVTNSTPTQNLSIAVLRTLEEANHNWTCEGFSADTNAIASVRTMTLDNTAPKINISSPPDIFSSLGDGDSVDLNWTITESNLKNCSYTYRELPELKSNDGINLSDTGVSNLLGWIYVTDKDTQKLRIFGVQQASSTFDIRIDKDALSTNFGTYQQISSSAANGSNITLTLNDNGWHMIKFDIRDFAAEKAWISQMNLSYPTTYAQNHTNIGDCTANTTTFNYVSGENSITMFADDIIGFANFTTQSWEILLLENNYSFDAFSHETSRDTFDINFSTSQEVLSITAFLNYNNTLYSTTSSCTSGVCVIETDIDLPLITSAAESENRSFFFEINGFSANETFLFNSTTRQQNVSRVHLEVCDATYTTTYLNFTAFDESTFTRITPFKISTALSYWLGSGTVRRSDNFTNTSTNELELCFDPFVKTVNLNGTVNYDEAADTNYTQRNYFFDNDSFTNVTTLIKLGLLKSDDSTTFILKVQDSDILPLSDILIYTQRYYPALDDFVTVAVSKTDDNGKTIGLFEVETVEYRFILKQNGETLLITNKQKMIPEDTPYTLTFTIGDDDGAAWAEYEPLDSLTSSLSFNKTSNVVTFSYVDTDTDFTLARLIVDKMNYTGLTNIEICDVNLSQATGSLTCNVSGEGTGAYTARALITRDGETTLVTQLLFSVEDFSSIAGNLGLFLGWLIILISAFAFKFNEIAGIIIMNATMIFVNLIGLIAFGPVFISAIVAISIIILVVLER